MSDGYQGSFVVLPEALPLSLPSAVLSLTSRAISRLSGAASCWARSVLKNSPQAARLQAEYLEPGTTSHYLKRNDS